MPSTEVPGSVDAEMGVAALFEGLPDDVKIVLAAGMALLVVLVLASVIRARRRARVRRWDGTKIAPRRKTGRPRTHRPPRERHDQKVSGSTEESIPEMMAASTRNYHQALEVLLRQPGKKTGVGLLKRLLQLARVLDQHRAGALQDLSGFQGDVEQLLGFEVLVRPLANSTGVALRLMHGGELVDEVPGPFRQEIADRVGERARDLQNDLVAWLDSLRRLGPIRRSEEPGAAGRPRPASAEPSHGPRVSTSSPIPTTIDFSGLPSLDEPPRSAPVPFAAHRGPLLREQPWAADDETAATDPPPSLDRGPSPRPPQESELDGLLRVAPPTAAAPRPSLLDLPPRLARSIEEVDDIVAELEVERPASLHAGERFFKADSSERTSLLERLDRLVFTRHDAIVRSAERGLDPRAVEAEAWFRRRQDELIETLRSEFGLRAYDPAIGDPFEPTAHVATDTVATGDQRRDRTVAGTVKHGYVIEIAGERRFLERPRVTVAVYESGALPAEEDAALVAEPPPREAGAGANHVLDVPVDSAYPGERDFSITVYARWPATAPLCAWIEVDGRRLAFARADLVAVKGGQSTVQLSGCDIPEVLGRGDGVLVVEDGGRRQARHPFEVLT